MNVLTSLVLVLFRPVSFWQKLDANQKLRITVEYLLFLIVISLVWYVYIVVSVIWEVYSDLDIYKQLVSRGIVRGISLYIAELLSIILMVVLLQSFLLLIKQRMKLYQVTLLVIYSYTPSIIFGYFLPNVIEAIYTFTLLFLGFRYFCKLPLRTSCIAVMLAVIALLISATAAGAVLAYSGFFAS